MESENYRAQKERAKQYRHWERTPEIQEKKQQQRALKLKAQNLRCLRRRMQKYKTEVEAGSLQEVPAQHKAVYEGFISGDLDRALDGLTEQHGYGQLRTRAERLGPLGFLRRAVP